MNRRQRTHSFPHSGCEILLDSIDETEGLLNSSQQKKTFLPPAGGSKECTEVYLQLKALHFYGSQVRAAGWISGLHAGLVREKPGFGSQGM